MLVTQAKREDYTQHQRWGSSWSGCGFRVRSRHGSTRNGIAGIGPKVNVSSITREQAGHGAEAVKEVTREGRTILRGQDKGETVVSKLLTAKDGRGGVFVGHVEAKGDANAKAGMVVGEDMMVVVAR